MNEIEFTRPKSILDEEESVVVEFIEKERDKRLSDKERKIKRREQRRARVKNR